MKKIVIYSLLIVLSAFTFSCKKSSSHVVRYTIQGTANATITYTDQNGNVQTVTNAPSDWSVSYSTNDNGLNVTLTAASIDKSNLAGKIYIDSKQTVASDGKSANVSITAIVP